VYSGEYSMVTPARLLKDESILIVSYCTVFYVCCASLVFEIQICGACIWYSTVVCSTCVLFALQLRYLYLFSYVDFMIQRLNSFTFKSEDSFIVAAFVFVLARLSGACVPNFFSIRSLSR